MTLPPFVILRAKPEGSHAKQVRDSSLTLRMTMKNSKLKSQSSKPQLKTLKPYPKTLLFVILKALSLIVILRAKPEGSHAKQVRDSSLTLRMTLPPFCHPERSEGSHAS